MQKHVKKIMDKIACETKTMPSIQIAMNPSVYPVSRFHLIVVTLGISSSSFRAARHRVYGWLKRATSSEVAKKTLLPKVNRLNR